MEKSLRMGTYADELKDLEMDDEGEELKTKEKKKKKQKTRWTRT